MTGQQVHPLLKGVGTDRTRVITNAAKAHTRAAELCGVTPWSWLETCLKLRGLYLPQDHTEAARHTLAVSSTMKGASCAVLQQLAILLASCLKCAKPRRVSCWHAPENVNGRGVLNAIVIEFLQGQPNVTGTVAGQPATPWGVQGKRPRFW